MCAGCRPARALLEVASAFHPVDAAAVDDELSALAACALAARCSGPVTQLETLGAAMEPFTVSDEPVGIDDLLLDRVLRRWSGVPLVLCAVAVEAGARAGLGLVVAADGHRHVVVHRGSPNLAWDPTRGVRPTGPDERARLRPRCGHQLAFGALALIVERAARAGDLSSALRASELRLGLPLTPALRSRVDAERASLLARLN